MSSIALEFENRLDDLLHADRLYYRHGVMAKVDKVVATVLGLLGAALVLRAPREGWGYVFLGLALVEWFNLLSLRPLQVRISFRGNPKFRERYSLSFDEAGIQFKTPTIDSRLKWDHYRKWLESDRVFVLVYGRWMYTVVPKSAFPGPGEIDLFRELLRRRVGGTAPPPSPA